MNVRTVKGTRYGSEGQQRERKKLKALRVPPDLNQLISEKARARSATHTDIMIEALWRGLDHA